MYNLINHKIRGFSLIETLIAITILMLAITGPLALVQAGLFSANHERNQITAIYLAQEALEYIRSLRDANKYVQYGTTDAINWLNGPGNIPLFDTSGHGSGSCEGGCMVDPSDYGGGLPNSSYVEGVNNNDGGNLPMYEKTTSDGTFISYGYSHTNAIPTTFTRTVLIKAVGANNEEVTVTVTINWQDNFLKRTYVVSENLMNYQIPE